MELGPLKKNQILDEVIIKRENNVVYVDFVLVSMVHQVEEQYCSERTIDMKSHKFNLIRSYDRKNFSNCRTLGQDRQDYLNKIDLEMQMRRH